MGNEDKFHVTILVSDVFMFPVEIGVIVCKSMYMDKQYNKLVENLNRHPIVWGGILITMSTSFVLSLDSLFIQVHTQVFM